MISPGLKGHRRWSGAGGRGGAMAFRCTNNRVQLGSGESAVVPTKFTRSRDSDSLPKGENRAGEEGARERARKRGGR